MPFTTCTNKMTLYINSYLIIVVLIGAVQSIVGWFAWMFTVEFMSSYKTKENTHCKQMVTVCCHRVETTWPNAVCLAVSNNSEGNWSTTINFLYFKE